MRAARLLPATAASFSGMRWARTRNHARPRPASSASGELAQLHGGKRVTAFHPGTHGPGSRILCAGARRGRCRWGCSGCGYGGYCGSRLGRPEPVLLQGRLLCRRHRRRHGNRLYALLRVLRRQQARGMHAQCRRLLPVHAAQAIAAKAGKRQHHEPRQPPGTASARPGMDIDAPRTVGIHPGLHQAIRLGRRTGRPARARHPSWRQAVDRRIAGRDCRSRRRHGCGRRGCGLLHDGHRGRGWPPCPISRNARSAPHWRAVRWRTTGTAHSSACHSCTGTDTHSAAAVSGRR